MRPASDGNAGVNAPVPEPEFFRLRFGGVLATLPEFFRPKLVAGAFPLFCCCCCCWC